MDEMQRIWEEIAVRPDGPLALRFYLQPTMASLLAFRDGRNDARLGKAPYFWALFTHREDRRELLKDGWGSIRKVFLLALALDVLYQLIVLRGLRPIEGLFVATLLALVPYVLLRGPINRIVRRTRHTVTEPRRSTPLPHPPKQA